MSTDQGATYAAFIAEQLKAEHARRTSLDERGAKLQQSAVVTVGLFTTALGLLVGKDGTVSGISLLLFAATVLVLTVAFLCGVVSTRLINYEVADANTFAQMLNAHWSDTETTSRNITAGLDARTIEVLRPGNNSKAKWLLMGIVCQGFGVVLGAVAFAVLAAARLAVA